MWRSQYMCLDPTSDLNYPLPGMARQYTENKSYHVAGAQQLKGQHTHEVYHADSYEWYHSSVGQAFYGTDGLAYSTANLAAKINCPSFAMNRLAVTSGAAQLDHLRFVLLPYLAEHGTAQEKEQAAELEGWIRKLERRFKTTWRQPNSDLKNAVQNHIYFVFRAVRLTCLSPEQAAFGLARSTCDFARIEFHQAKIIADARVAGKTVDTAAAWHVAAQIVRGETSDLRCAIALAKEGAIGLEVRAFGAVPAVCFPHGLEIKLVAGVSKPLSHVGPLMSQMLKAIGGEGMISQEHALSFMAQSALIDPFHLREFATIQNAVVCTGFLATTDFGTTAITDQLVNSILMAE